ncbi:MAG: hypothetical protein MI717_14875 [Spirochaetales bacterium]|nr:hypothetical protein [Spirochaetales bacterium]
MITSLLFVFTLFVSCEAIVPLGNALKSGQGQDPQTPPPPTMETPWGAPQDFRGFSGKNGFIDLQWSPVDGAEYYLVSYSPNPFGDFSLPLDEIPQGANTNQVVTWRLEASQAQPLEPGTVLYFRIKAVGKNAIMSPLSDMVVASVLDRPQLAAPILSPGQVELRWSLPSLRVDGIDYTPSFEVLKRVGEADFSVISTPEAISGGNGAFSFRDEGVDPNTDYQYKVRVTVEGADQSLESALLDVRTLDQSYPNAVERLQIYAGSFANAVHLTWQPPTALAGYESTTIVYSIVRSSNTGERVTLLDKAENTLQFSDTTAEENVVYNYVITTQYKTTNDDGSIRYSIAGVEESGAGYRLWVPTNVRATPEAAQVTVEWDYPDDKAESVSFVVYREADVVDGVSEELVRGTKARSFVDDTLGTASGYFYRVEALSGTQANEVSRAVRIPTAVSIAPPPTALVTDLTVSQGLADRISLSWTGVTDATYKIYGNATGYGYTASDLLAEDLTPNGELGLSYTENSLNAGTVRFYRVEGTLNGSTTVEDSVRGYVLAVPGAPTASAGLYKDKIRVHWASVEGATSYELAYRRDNSDGDFTTYTGSFTPEDLNSPSGDFVPPGNEDPAIRGVGWTLAIRAVRTFEDGTRVVSSNSPTTIGYALGPALINLRATSGVYNNRVGIRWDAVTGAERYDIYRGESEDPALARRVFQNVRELEIYDEDAPALTQGVSLYYFIRPLRRGVNSNVLSRPVEGFALSPPTGITASQGTSTNNIDLTWTAPPGAGSYNIYRQNGSNWLRVATGVTGTSFSYPVTAEDLASGNAEVTFSLTSITSVTYLNGLESLRSSETPTGYVLSRPIGVSASQGDTSLHVYGNYYTRISWPEVRGARGYEVQRKDDRSNDWISLGTVPAGNDDVAKYDDYNGLSLTNYKQKYRVKTFRGSLSTSWSEEVYGYRQVSAAEFLNIVNTTLRRSMQALHFNSGNAGGSLRQEYRNGLVSGRYTHGIDRNGFFGTNYTRYFAYSNFKDYFVTLNGSFRRTNGGGVPANARHGLYQHSGTDSDKLTIVGPFGANGLYSGHITFEDMNISNDDGGSPNWSGGRIKVEYNGQVMYIDRNSGVPVPYHMDWSRFVNGVAR